jgi:hypothetical protein
MKSEPSNGRRLPGPLHPETIAFEAKLREFIKGQSVTHRELAATIHKEWDRMDVKARGLMSAHLRSATRMLCNQRGYVFGPLRDAEGGTGIVRLDDVGNITKGTRDRTKIHRAAKRLSRNSALADPDVLTDDLRREQGVQMIGARIVEKMTSKKGREVVLRLTSNSAMRLPDLDPAMLKSIAEGLA